MVCGYKVMKTFTTIIRAIDPESLTLKTYSGPNIQALNFQDAQDYCNINGLGYCKVDGELISEIPCKNDGVTPDFRKSIDYSLTQMN